MLNTMPHGYVTYFMELLRYIMCGVFIIICFSHRHFCRPWSSWAECWWVAYFIAYSVIQPPSTDPSILEMSGKCGVRSLALGLPGKANQHTMDRFFEYRKHILLIICWCTGFAWTRAKQSFSKFQFEPWCEICSASHCTSKHQQRYAHSHALAVLAEFMHLHWIFFDWSIFRLSSQCLAVTDCLRWL